MDNETKANWQEVGGAITIPIGWFVCGADLDADEPFLKICNSNDFRATECLPFPKPIAYYLTTHTCGSERMRTHIREDMRREIVDKIKRALGL
jgi:hypothetical protein